MSVSIANPTLDARKPTVERASTDVVDRLREVRLWLDDDLARVESELALIRDDTPALHPGARHLLGLRGKRVRPMCVVVATRFGAGFGPAALDLAVAAELIHSATLLHDDVIDDGEQRRGEPTAQVLYGNASSILSGDWLLIQALKRIRRVAPIDVYDRALTTVEEMIEAEALQLENRGRLDAPRSDYFRVIEGKTAALFRWALYAGARAGSLPDDQCTQLVAFGDRVGVAFQLVDDVLDFNGDASVTGKAVLNDLREGKMTYPLLLALERDPSLPALVEELHAQPHDHPASKLLVARVVATVRATGGVDDCLEIARERVAEAIACLGPLPRGRAHAALVTLGEAVLHRMR